MKWSKVSRLEVLLVLFLTLAYPMVAVAHTVKTDLNGYEETPLTLSTPGSGEFRAKISEDRIYYTLTYRDTESAVTQAHIHLGLPAIGGGIVVFLCTNLGNAPATVPTPQLCPAAPATIRGILTAADVGASAGSIAQGINLGEFDELVRAIRAGATYVNVHTIGRAGGEIRGQIDRRHQGHDND